MKKPKKRKTHAKKKTAHGGAKGRARSKKGSRRGKARAQKRDRRAAGSEPVYWGRTVYRNVYSQRQRRRIEITRTQFQRKRVRSLGTRAARAEVSREIVEELGAWQQKKPGFRGKKARANIELRVRGGDGRLYSKWVSFKRRQLVEDDLDYLPDLLEGYISGYQQNGLEVVGFRSVEFEAARNAHPKASRKKAKKSKAR